FVPPPGTPNPMAEANDYLKKAEQLLNQVIQTSTDPSERVAASNQLLRLRQSAAGPVGQPGYPANAAVTPASSGPKVDLRMQPASQPTGGNTALYQTASQSNGAAKWTSWGKLKKTALRQQDGQPVFRLEEERGTFVYA